MKETFYFSHDYNTRDDEKIMNMLAGMGTEGYGLYWILIETLAQNDGKIKLDSIKGLGYKLRCDNTLITQLLHNYNLFIIDEEEGIFYNNRILKHLSKREESKQRKSEAGKKGMAKRWGKDNTVITEDNITITNDNKGKESKGKERKGNNSLLKKFSQEEYMENSSAYLLKTFYKLGYKESKTETVETFRLWFKEKIIDTHTIKSTKEINRIIDNFDTYWSEQDKSINNYKTTFMNNPLLKEYAK